MGRLPMSSKRSSKSFAVLSRCMHYRLANQNKDCIKENCPYFCAMLKCGILGGGQLGRMLLQAAANYPVETHVLENDNECPAAHLCRFFVKGDICDFDAVYNFGKGLDAI